MKLPTLFALLALVASSTLAASAQPAGSVHHQVSANAEAQAAFDRGLLDYYAYNPEAAEHEFYTAADLDPHAAMAFWGIALSNAPNLNVPPTDDRDNQASEAIDKAKRLETYATAEDRAFIDAAAARLSPPAGAKPAALLVTYRDALQKIANAYPQDPDAAALYAEASLYAAVDLYSFGNTELKGAALAAAMAKAAALLPMFQASLASFPQHPGLLHFYIHTAQFAGDSAVAVEAAKTLASFTFPPEDSHLTHMPGHTFFDVGMYDAALDVGTRSVAMDAAEIACCHPGYYSATRYYHNHNVSFVLYAMTQTGHLDEAIALARAENNNGFLARQLVAAGRWQDVVALPYAKGADQTATFTHGLASAKLGDVTSAQRMLSALPKGNADSPSQAATLAAMHATLAAEIAEARHDDTAALALLAEASASASKVGPTEIPPLYYYSPHMALAKLAIKLGKTDVAKAALQAELVASPKSNAALQALAQL